MIAKQTQSPSLENCFPDTRELTYEEIRKYELRINDRFGKGIEFLASNHNIAYGYNNHLVSLVNSNYGSGFVFVEAEENPKKLLLFSQQRYEEKGAKIVREYCFYAINEAGFMWEIPQGESR